MLKLSDLALRRDFRVGALAVSPARRTVSGPVGELHVEPLIMQVFLLLLDARGKVVTRTELFDQCWGGVMVGDDSLNRTVAGVRRIAAETAPDLFKIETIPRTGYRMSGDIVGLAEEEEPETAGGDADGKGVSRRMLVGGGLATGAAALGGIWWLQSSRRDPRAEAALDEGRRVLRDAWPGSNEEAVRHFRSAAAIEPDNAEAWGLLALAYRQVAEEAPSSETATAVVNCDAAAKRALRIDRREPNARVALATLRPEFGNWSETENAVRSVLADYPKHVPALTYLVMLLQSVGRAQESWDLNERVLELDPLSPVHLFRRAMKHWIFGRIAEADLAIERALRLWPRHPAVWNTRMLIFAFSGRPEAATAFLEDAANRPRTFRPTSSKIWQVSLRALESRSPSDIAAAHQANIEAARRSPGFATRAMMVLSYLGRVDDAFAVADGFLLRRGPLVGSLWTGSGEMPVNDHYWRRTMNLFTPATAAMRADPRFAGLCEGIGLTQYWQVTGVPPDAMFRSA